MHTFWRLTFLWRSSRSTAETKLSTSHQIFDSSTHSIASIWEISGHAQLQQSLEQDNLAVGQMNLATYIYEMPAEAQYDTDYHDFVYQSVLQAYMLYLNEEPHPAKGHKRCDCFS